jgi:hypothetical protein
MAIFQWVISAFWLIFFAYWAILAIGVKRSVEETAWWKQKRVASLVSGALHHRCALRPCGEPRTAIDAAAFGP